MAYEGVGRLIPGLIAGSGLTADSVQFKFVYLSADRTVSLIDNPETQAPVGVLQAPVKAAGDAVAVVWKGITKLRMAAGSPAAGDTIGPDTDGQAVTRAVTDTTYYVCGQFIETLSATDSGVIGVAAIDCAIPQFAK